MRIATILNVDDSAANRYLKSRALRQAGFAVVEADTGAAAIDLAMASRPDLILLDIKLPDISGLDVCRQLKEDPRTAAIPVVHISATFVEDEIKSRSADAGAEVYLAEPIGPHQLASTVRTVLRLRHAERTLAESEARMRLATEGAGIATWDIAVESGAAVWSPQFYAMLGCDPATTRASIATWIERVRADERETLAAALEAALRGGGPFAVEHWITRPEDGAERYIVAYGSTQVDPGSGARRLIGVAMDVTARKQAEAEREALLEQAQAAQREAEASARTKDEFLAMLSHELRTPMSAVLGWLHILRTAELPPEQRERALATIERNARLQSQIVSDLLDVSRIVTGKLVLENDAVRADQVVELAVESARVAAAERGIVIIPRLAREGGVVIGSAARLQQVFGNLLSNAIKFSPVGGRVEVDLDHVEGGVRIRVRDHGEGIAPDLLPHIFDSFRQSDSSLRRRHGGLGLGLAISRSLVLLHGGSIVANSEGEGRGASFTVRLPFSSAPPGALPPDRDPEPVAGAAPDLRGVRVLVVDDNADHLLMTAETLRLEGLLVSTAGDASEALRAAAEAKPELLVLDIGMPGLDGYELLHHLRKALGATPATLPAIALTGFASAADAARARAAAFQGHLAKPFEIAEFRRLMARALVGR